MSKRSGGEVGGKGGCRRLSGVIKGTVWDGW